MPNDPAPLQIALEHLGAGRSVGALVALLDAWRAFPAVEIADLIDGVSLQIDRSLAPLKGSEHQVHEMWVNLATKREPANVGRLLPGIAFGACGLARLRRRLELLQTFPRDPRLVGSVLRTIGNLRTAIAQPMWSMGLALCIETNDARSLALLDDLTAVTQNAAKHDSFNPKALAARIEKIRLGIAPAPLVSDQDRAILGECAKALAALAAAPPPTEDVLLAATTPVAAPKPSGAPEVGASLLDAILQAPDDDGARQVYGDWLLERQDPRGELIALQYKGISLSTADKKRERELLKKHALEWCRPIDVTLKPGHVGFARGFLDSCSVRFPTKAQRAELLGHPMWATVREIETKEMALVTHPCMRSMRRATLNGAALSLLARRKQPVLLEAAIGGLDVLRDGLMVSTRLTTRHAEQWADALAIGALVNLRAVCVEVFSPNQNRVVDAEQLQWLISSPLGGQLEELEVWTPGAHAIGGWIEIMNDRPKLRRVLLRANGGDLLFVLEREPDDTALLRLRVQTRGFLLRWATPALADWFDLALRGFPSAKVPRISLEHVAKGPVPVNWSHFNGLFTTRFSTIDFAEQVPALAI